MYHQVQDSRKRGGWAVDQYGAGTPAGAAARRGPTKANAPYRPQCPSPRSRRPLDVRSTIFVSALYILSL